MNTAVVFLRITTMPALMPALLAGLILTALAAGADEPSGQAVDFNRHIQPILANHCFTCHGPDEQTREAGLRLDWRDSAVGRLESDLQAIVPGDPEASELIRRVVSTDQWERMPPADTGKQLQPEQIGLLKRWIEQGAEYADHWSFLPPGRPELPKVGNPDWPRNEIDHFILARLEQEGLQPSPEASKETLIRRLSLDLTGIPPTPHEVDAFLADHSPDAYEKVVDRLLNSHRYGELMAKQWLDFARYADSNGFQDDSSRVMWRWRDWVIGAYNQNMPFDRFAIEQLAGDLLPDATLEQKVATGFNRNHRTNSEGGLIAEEWRIETVIDRVETTSLTWMGLTMGCARCHDHKYDPVSQKEFYQFFAFFNNVPESGASGRNGQNTPPLIPAPLPEHQSRLQELEAAVAAAQQEVQRLEQTVLPELLAQWEQTALQDDASQTVWTPVQAQQARASGGATLKAESDGTVQVRGVNPANDVYTLTLPTELKRVTGLRIEVLPDEQNPTGGVGRSANGNFVLTSFGTGRRDDQPLYDRLWGAGFLPSKHQGVKFRNQGDAVLYLSNPPGVDAAARRSTLDRLAQLNGQRFDALGDPEIQARISQYEMAFRMQSSVPDLLDFSSEPQHVLDLYGPDVAKPGTYAANCLLARRLAERDVRFVQLFHMGWDHHGGLPNAIRGQCRDTDQPTAALIKDLKQRGLFEDTLIVWGGEFGRTIYSQGALTETNYGRDHHPRCFTTLLAGGGVQGGVTYGETDDYCYNIVRDPVHVHDLNATVLHLMGIDHTRLVYCFQGRDFRLTDVHGDVVKKLLA